MATQPDLDLQADIDTLTIVLARLEALFVGALAPYAETLGRLREDLAVLHEVALDPLGKFERARAAFLSGPAPDGAPCLTYRRSDGAVSPILCWQGTTVEYRALARVLQQMAGGQQVAATGSNSAPFPGYCGMYRGAHIFEGEALGFVWRPLEVLRGRERGSPDPRRRSLRSDRPVRRSHPARRPRPRGRDCDPRRAARSRRRGGRGPRPRRGLRG